MSQAGKLLAERLRAKLDLPEDNGLPIDSIFEEEPVDLTTFIQDKKFMNSPPLSDIQFDAVRHLEQIYLPSTYPAMVEAFGPQWDPVRFVNLCYIEWGKGSGKDSICRIANARIAYLLLCLKSPQKYFGMPPQDEIQTLNVAASSTQAHRAFFRPLATMCRRSPWFKDKLLAEPSDMSTSIRFKKQIEMVSGHSQADTLEGLNLIFAIADEISAFRTKEELERFAALRQREPTKSAEAILKLLRTSAATRFPKNYKMAAISYPRFKGDAIQQLIQRGLEDNDYKKSKSRYYVSGPYATWDVNPRIESKDDFAEDYETDPDMAEAMYECNPKLSENRYFKNEVAIYAALDDQRYCPLDITYEWGIDPEIGTKPGWQPVFNFDPNFHPIEGAVYALHGDMAISGDRAGVAMSHVKRWQLTELDSDTPQDKPMESRPVVFNDFTTYFSADAGARLPDDTPLAREVQIRWFRRLVQELVRRKFAVGLVTFDQFQSADSIQILNAWGIESKRVSMDINAAPWATLRDVMYEHRLEGHYSPLLRDEILALTRLPNGKVDHPQGGSKDCADALAGSVLGALELGGDEGDDPQYADAPGMGDYDLTVSVTSVTGSELTWLSDGAFGVPESLQTMKW